MFLELAFFQTVPQMESYSYTHWVDHVCRAWLLSFSIMHSDQSILQGLLYIAEFIVWLTSMCLSICLWDFWNFLLTDFFCVCVSFMNKVILRTHMQILCGHISFCWVSSQVSGHRVKRVFYCNWQAVPEVFASFCILIPTWESCSCSAALHAHGVLD